MKNVISIIVIILSLLIFALIGILLTVNYKQVQKEFIDLLSANATSEVVISKVEIDKFPSPKIIAHDIKIPGILEAKNMVVNFSLISILQGKPKITTITARQPDFDLSLLVKYEGDKLSYGKANIKTRHIALFLKDYPDLQAIMTNLIPANSTDLNFDLVASGEYLTFTNLNINSDKLKCSGEIALSRSPAAQSNMQLKCDKVKLLNEELANVSLSGKSDALGLHLDSAKGDISSGGGFDISGDLTQNAFRSAFEGKLRVDHNDLNIALEKLGMKSLAAKNPSKTVFESDIKITPAEFLLNNLKSQIGSLGITGSSNIRLIGGMPRLFLNFNINGFDSNIEYPAISPLLKYFTSLAIGTEERGYITKFIPIRNIDYLGSYDLTFASPLIPGNAVDNLTISGKVSPGKIEVKSFDYSALSDHITGFATLDTISIKPVFSLSITGGTWNTDILSISNLLTTNASLQSADLSKINLLVDASLQSLTQNEIKLNDVKLNIRNDGNIISIPHMSANVGASDTNINGTIAIGSSLKADLAYVYNSADVSTLGRFFGLKAGLNGIANFAGVVNTYGSTAEELLYNLKSKSKFIASNIDTQGFGIDDFVNKISNLSYIKNNLDKDIDQATTSGNTAFKDITGNLNIDTGVISLVNVELTGKYSSGALGGAYNIYNQDWNYSSLWSFQLPITPTIAAPVELSILMQKKGGDIINNVDSSSLQNAFESRAVQNMISNSATSSEGFNPPPRAISP